MITKVRIMKNGFLLYSAFINRTGYDSMWKFVGVTLTKRGAKRAVHKYLYPKDRIIEEYTVG